MAQKQRWQHPREGQSQSRILWVVLSTGHSQKKPLSVKSESGHCLKCLCLLQSLKFPQENSICWARILSSKPSWPSLEAFSVFLCILQSARQLSGVKLFFNKLPSSETSHCVAYLYHAWDTWLVVCVWLFLEPAGVTKEIFLLVSLKARMPFLIFPCDALLSLYGLPSKSESLGMEEAFPMVYSLEAAPRDSARTFNTNIKTPSPYGSSWAL